MGYTSRKQLTVACGIGGPAQRRHPVSSVGRVVGYLSCSAASASTPVNCRTTRRSSSSSEPSGTSFGRRSRPRFRCGRLAWDPTALDTALHRRSGSPRSRSSLRSGPRRLERPAGEAGRLGDNRCPFRAHWRRWSMALRIPISGPFDSVPHMCPNADFWAIRGRPADGGKPCSS
jgi:hypothetical protein